MSRPRRYSPGGMVFHVLNRGVGRRMLFTKDEDFLAFERVIEESLRTRRMRLCAYCLMSNHWHFILWPERDGDLPAFMQRWKQRTTSTGSFATWSGTPCALTLRSERKRGVGRVIVNQPRTDAELAALRCCVIRGRPFGDPNWVTDTAKRLGLEWTLRPRGRLKKQA